MASVVKRYNRQGEITSCQIRVYKGKDENGRDMSPYTKSVKKPKDMSEKQFMKMVSKEAVTFEEQCTGGIVGNPNILFRDFAKQVIELKKQSSREKSTISHYNDMLNSRILDYFGHMKISDITVGHLNNFYSELVLNGQNKKSEGKGLSPKTVKKYHSLISTIFKEAVKQRIVTYNPAESASVPTAVRGLPNYYQEDELMKIKSFTDEISVKWKAILYLLMTYGIRRSEVAGIKRSAIDFKKHTIKIESCVLYNKEFGVYSKDYPKSQKVRLLPMNETVENVLKEYLAWLDKEKVLYGDMWKETDFIFAGESGGLMNPDNITQWLNRMTEKMKKTDPDFPKLNPHAFRHTVASLLISKGMDFVAVAEYIGDVPQTVANNYAHGINKRKIEALGEMGTILSGN